MFVKELFYIPNILEYIRLYLLYRGLITKDIIFFAFNYLLDLVDGFVARKLNQTSDLGCFLDHFVDRLTISIPSLMILYYNNFDIFLVFSLIECFTNIFFNFIKSNSHMKHSDTKNQNTLVNYYYSNGRYNMLSYCSLLPYMFYSPLVYCCNDSIPLPILYFLRFGVFLYFIIFTQKIKIWCK